MSRIAVFTDVHGNQAALAAVLQEIDQLPQPVDQIYCLGDLVAIGPDTNEVLATLFARPDIAMVRGNHDDAVLAILSGRVLRGHEMAAEHHRWIAARLNPAFVPRLAALPYTLVHKAAGKTVLLEHYHQTAPGEFAPIDRSPSAQSLDARYEGVAADAVCFGHHHPLHYFRSPRRVYVNPGALGCCDRPVARYALLDLSGPEIRVDLREVPYDDRAFRDSYERLQVPDAEFILRVLAKAAGGSLIGT
jgi:putative phosphoesterase